MKVRLTALAAVAALGLGTMPADAALPPQITDASGDVKGTAAYDIVSVTFDTLKTTTTTYKKVGKKKKAVKTVTPTDFIVTMQLAGPPSVAPGTSYQVIAEDTPCGIMYAFTYFGALDGGPTSSLQFGNCGPETDLGDSFLVEAHTLTTVGNTLVWKAPLKVLPKQVKVNSVFGSLFAYSAPTEPVIGYSGADFAPTPEVAEAATFDYASTDKVYKLGS